MKTIIKLQRYTTHTYSLIAVVVLSLFFYFYAIAGATINLADAEDIRDASTALQTEIAMLEAEYYELMHGISLTEASEFGFSETSEVAYVAVDSDSSFAYRD